MSLSSILSAATSGLAASQAQIRSTSTNVSNVNTPGYARIQTGLSTRTVDGAGMGVDVTTITRATNIFLQRASLSAQGDQAAAAALNSLWTQLAPYLGTANQEGALTSRLSQLSAAFSASTADPSSSLRRSQVVAAAQNLLSEVSNLSQTVSSVRAQADSQLGGQITSANDLLGQIANLNLEISRTKAQGGDSTGSENQQAAVIDQLSQLIGIRVDTRQGGGVIVRTPDGITLADGEAATINYAPTGQGGPNAVYGAITVTLPGSSTTQGFDAHIESGSIAGLLHARDGDMPDLLRSVGELASGIADALNEAHNAASSFPPPASMAGRQTGLLSADSLGFTGKTTIALVNANGSLAHKIAIDFTAGTISLDGGATVSTGTTVGSFATALNGVLTGAGLGTASFTNGALSLSASGGAGIAIQDDATTPASRGGRGLSQFFGLNDFIQSDRPTFYQTGLSAADTHGFTAGAMQFQIRNAAGVVVDTKSITVGGTTIQDILNSLNNTASGVGLYSTFSLNANGELVQTPAPGAETYSVNLTSDNTTRGATGLSFSQIFGVGDAARAARATDVEVNPLIAASNTKLAFAKADLGGALGTIALTSGDARGATALASAFETSTNFSAAGGLAAVTTSVNSFASQVLGLAGSRAARADAAEVAAKDLTTDVAARRGSVDGVNLDEDLANLTLYQQAYNASARLIQAAQDMMDTLLSIRS
ncbi:MAG: flagellar hook-associated protein FlgK [Caulobacterales bacterium]